MEAVVIAHNGDTIAREIVFGNAFKRIPENTIPADMLSFLIIDSMNRCCESVLYVINTETNLIMRLSSPLYKYTSREVVCTTYRLATVISGEYRTMSFQYASVNGAKDVMTIDVLHESLFETYEEAQSAMENYIQNEKPLYVNIPYGSFFYNESRDRDFLCLRFHGEKNLPKIDRIKNVVTVHHSNGSDDMVHMYQSPMSRLALECAMIEYPEIKDILSEFVTMPLIDALEENAAYRLRIAEFFQADFTLRKAVFAKLQRDIYKSVGIFCDTKSKIIDVVVVDYPVDAINRLLYHNASREDLSEVYAWFFNRPMPSSTRDGYALQENDRDLYVIRDGKIYVSEYQSDYDNDEVHLIKYEEEMKNLKNMKIVEVE